MGAVIGDGEEDGMSDDLVDELQQLAVTPWLNSQARAACRSAADEIERLRAELQMVTTQRDAFFQTVADQRAVIAEALSFHTRGEVYQRPGEGMVTTDDDLIVEGCQVCEEPWPCRTVVILSRVPQGAAEPSPTLANKEPSHD